MIYNESEKPRFNFRLQPGTQQQMRPCPFCGHRSAELHNTHTPSYWIECGSCGCQLHDPRSARGDGERSHRASALRVITAWNSRWAGSASGERSR